MSSEIDPAVIRLFVNQIIIENYVLYATLAVLIYDLIDSFEKEIKHFWFARKSTVAVLYFANRYAAILVTILDLLSRLVYFSTVLDLIIVLCVDYILLLRVRALYSRGRAISIILFAVFGIETIASIVIAIQGLVAEDPEAIGIAPGLTLCVEANAAPAVEHILSWGIPLAYGALLLALAIYKAAVIWKESAGLKGLSLVKVLIRDQAIYFLAVIFVCFANIVSNVVDPFTLLGSVLNFAGNPAFLSILGARLLFNMKEAGEKGLNQGTHCPMRTTMSEIDFAAPPAGAVESSLGQATGHGGAEIEEVPSEALRGDVEMDLC